MDKLFQLIMSKISYIDPHRTGAGGGSINAHYFSMKQTDPKLEDILCRAICDREENTACQNTNYNGHGDQSKLLKCQEFCDKTCIRTKMIVNQLFSSVFLSVCLALCLFDCLTVWMSVRLLF